MEYETAEEFYATDFPPATANPCAECPWVRTAIPGYLGPLTADAWCEVAHGESPIACHMTIKHTHVDEDGDPAGDWDDPAMRQCKGAAIFRGNISKSPRHPQILRAEQDYELVFGWDNQFIEHHNTPRLPAGRGKRHG